MQTSGELSALQVTFKANDETEARTLDELQAEKAKKKSKSIRLCNDVETQKSTQVASLVASINEQFDSQKQRFERKKEHKPSKEPKHNI